MTMRRNFKEGLEAYNDIAKDKSRSEKREDASIMDAPASEEIVGVEGVGEDLDAVLSWHLTRQAERGGTDVPAQERIFALQERKRKVMDRLRAELAALDGKGEMPSAPDGARRIVGEGGLLVWVGDDGRRRNVTIGEIVTDGAWGIEYDLDAETVPRMARKRAIVERAKREVEELLDEQILEQELASDRVHEWKKGAYAALRETREKGELRFGHIAERMISQYMRKLAIDRALPYRVENADVYQDVERKMDFIIKRRERGRGVKVEAGEGRGMDAKGVQFTLNRNAQVLERKRRQIERSKRSGGDDDRVDDLMLVVMADKKIGEAYDKWQKKGRPPGGPDRYLNGGTRHAIFMELLRGMADDAELEEEWSRISSGS